MKRRTYVSVGEFGSGLIGTDSDDVGNPDTIILSEKGKKRL